ncbi:alcohol dehydrogenase, propanol-preferring [Alteribacillus persepolensis]|uniref:Alcohol dehydrogenase, propanol-preferring n=1 Tax=Alteribacillus persepolensis TaxID=568899 RepID=A0A1G8HRH8_9BACI|nr:zinc-dependent alcohol dehydrogenase family protein [Alteribacillus persepolensis]SDI09268.1 alcohol dehydrogenase, propanol-preferring [Alteribacillus persepolensis]
MKALVVTELKKDLEVMNMPDPSLTPDGVVIQVKANGICRSDWHLWQGDFSWVGLDLELPHILGHEFSGVVEEVGKNVTKIKKGDRVVVPHAHGDGTCEYCITGHANLCENPAVVGVTYHGGFGEFVHVPHADQNVIRLPDNVGYEAAAGLGCRFMTAFHGIVDQVNVKPGEWVAVHGCGGVGLSSIHVATAMGANVIAVDINDEPLALAKEHGAKVTINGKEKDAVNEIKELTKGGAHVAIDALGITATCQNAIYSLRKRGRLLQLGMTSNSEKGMIPLPIDLIVTTELSVNGSANMPISRFPDMMRMVEGNFLQPEKLITRTVGLEEAGKVLKSMSTFQSPGVSVLNRW